MSPARARFLWLDGREDTKEADPEMMGCIRVTAGGAEVSLRDFKQGVEYVFHHFRPENRGDEWVFVEHEVPR